MVPDYLSVHYTAGGSHSQRFMIVDAGCGGHGARWCGDIKTFRLLSITNMQSKHSVLRQHQDA
jgi:hypothetical protein